MVRLILIPSRNEYIDASLDSLLWCNRNELGLFQYNTAAEITLEMKNSNIPYGDAMTKLFKIKHEDIESEMANSKISHEEAYKKLFDNKSYQASGDETNQPTLSI